jgi:signal transduction histidine kinase
VEQPSPPALRVSEIALITGGVLTAAVTSHGSQWRPLLLVVVLAIVSALGESFAAANRRKAIWSSSVGYVLAAALLGLAPALTIAALGRATVAARTRDGWALLNKLAAIPALTIAAALLFGDRLGALHTGAVHSAARGEAFVATLFAVYLACHATTFLFAALEQRIRAGTRLLAQLRSQFAPVLPVLLLTDVLISAIGLAYTTRSPAVTMLATATVAVILFQMLGIEIDRSRDRAEQLTNHRTDRLRHVQAVRELVNARCAEALHEDVVNELSRLRYRLAVAASATHVSRLELDRSLEVLSAESTGLRSLISELRPAALDRQGLLPALEDLAARTALREGLSVDIKASVPEGALALDADAQAAAYRIVEEALNNAIRHAHASRVTIAVQRHDATTQLVITDDGIGFSPAAATAGPRPQRNARSRRLDRRRSHDRGRRRQRLHRHAPAAANTPPDGPPYPANGSTIHPPERRLPLPAQAQPHERLPRADGLHRRGRG